MRWSESDNYFVSGSLKIYSVVDLSPDPLKLVSEENIIYDGPKGDDFKSLLLDNGFRVNRQGKTIVRVPKRNAEQEFNFFLLQMVLPLERYGFANLPSSSSTQEVEVLKSLLEESRANLAKKNAEVDELRRQILDWQLNMDAITRSMKKVFVDADDLTPPPPPPPPTPAASTSRGYPLISVLVGFLNKLRSQVFVNKEELGSTFLATANEILSSIASIFYLRTALKIGMETSTTTTITPADLIQNLNSLKEFVERRFLIDGSVIVKVFGLMNEKDIPVIFRDSERGVDELKQKGKSAISMDNIEGKSIFYGYFNIPSFGTFKGILTKIEVTGAGPTLPDEIMVKLSHRPYKLDMERFWFVKANGEAIFENNKSSSLGVDFLGFLRRMINKTFVNKDGRYLLFDFTAIRILKPPSSSQIDEDDNSSMHFYWEEQGAIDPFSKVRYDANETPSAVLERRVSLPQGLAFDSDDWSFVEGTFGTGAEFEDCAFVCKGFCFIGKITQVSGPAFRNNAVVSVFFEQSKHETECFVDALATTYFVLNPAFKLLKNPKQELPQII